MSDLFTPADIQTNDVTDPLEALVGEGKKFKTVADLAKAKLESDAFIEQLKREAAELRNEVSSKATIDEIMTQIRSLSPKPPVEAQPNPSPANPPSNPDDLETVVLSLLDKKSKQETLTRNQQLVEQKLTEKWGADAQINLTKRANELGVDLNYLKKMAYESPNSFFELVGLNRQPAASPPLVAPRSGVNVQPPQDGVNRNQAYYTALKQKNPTEYFSPKVQNQMMKDALNQGSTFFS